MVKRLLGVITHFYPKAMAAVISVRNTISTGDSISIEGPETNVQQKIEFMQVDGKLVNSAKGGKDVGLKVTERVRKGDHVYLETTE